MRFNHTRTLLFALPFTLTLASAQQGGGQAGQRQMTPEMRARMQQMQPILDLSQTVRLLPDLEKNKATALTKAQAKSLLTILTTLQKASAVQPNDAKKYLTQIEDKILTDKQLTALDAAMLKAEKEREAQRARRQSGQGAGARIPGVPGGFLPGAGGRRPGGQNAQGQNGQGGSQASSIPSSRDVEQTSSRSTSAHFRKSKGDVGLERDIRRRPPLRKLCPYLDHSAESA